MSPFRALSLGLALLLPSVALAADSDGDSLDDAVECACDTDGDGLQDKDDPDDDNDGIGTLYEREQRTDDGGPNLCGYTSDHLDPDSDDDNVLDGAEWSGLEQGSTKGTNSDPRDSDGDGCINALDDDDDNDDIPTLIEGGEGSQFDVDGDPAKNCAPAPDGLPNYLDTDSDGDANDTKDTKSNGLDGSETYESDKDQDGIPDVLDCADNDGCDSDPDADGLTNCEEHALGSNGNSADSDGDGLPDAEEVGDIAFPENTDGDLAWEDADKDGVIDGGAWTDTNGDGNIDEAEYFGNSWNDKDKDGRVDPGEGEIRPQYDLIDADDDGDHVPTAVEVANGDTDDDKTPDYLDEDDDNDGFLSVDEESQSPDNDPTNDDTDGDSIPDYLDNNPCDAAGGDCDKDQISNAVESGVGSDPDSFDSDLDGGWDFDEWCRGQTDCDPATSTPTDSDGDKTPDVLDTDDDNDGVTSEIETWLDSDGDGVPNALDLDPVPRPRVDRGGTPSPISDGSSCDSSATSSVGAWLLGVGLLARRRRITAR